METSQYNKNITDGYSIDNREDYYYCYCPFCDYEITYEGYFDSEDICKCPSCKEEFYISKIWINEFEYIS